MMCQFARTGDGQGVGSVCCVGHLEGMPCGSQEQAKAKKGSPKRFTCKMSLLQGQVPAIVQSAHCSKRRPSVRETAEANSWTLVLGARVESARHVTSRTENLG